MPKYDAIQSFLRAQPLSSNEVTVEVREIEKILGDELPDSAFIYRAWWSNNSLLRSNPQARSWISTGFLVDDVKQDRETGWVRFKRKKLGMSQSFN